MKKSLLVLPMLALFLGYSAISQTPAKPKHHVIIQMSEPEAAWGTLFLHVNNSMKAFEKDGGLQVEVIFFGSGLSLLNKTSKAYEERLKQISDAGVKLVACKNAMKARNVKSEDLFPFAEETDSGVAEIIRKQEAGWAYVH